MQQVSRPREIHRPPTQPKETTMNSFASNLYRDLTCAAAAALITLVFCLSFVQSTSVPPGTHSGASRTVAMQSDHAWFGQPEPAVLVD